MEIFPNQESNFKRKLAWNDFGGLFSQSFLEPLLVNLVAIDGRKPTATRFIEIFGPNAPLHKPQWKRLRALRDHREILAELDRKQFILYLTALYRHFSNLEFFPNVEPNGRFWTSKLIRTKHMTAAAKSGLWARNMGGNLASDKRQKDLHVQLTSWWLVHHFENHPTTITSKAATMVSSDPTKANLPVSPSPSPPPSPSSSSSNSPSLNLFQTCNKLEKALSSNPDETTLHHSSSSSSIYPTSLPLLEISKIEKPSPFIEAPVVSGNSHFFDVTTSFGQPAL